MTGLASIRPIALTMGDPAGIGGELTLAAWLALRGRALPFVVLDDPSRLQHLANALGLPVPIRIVSNLATVSEMFSDALPVLPVPLPARPSAGCPDQTNTGSIVTSIERATRLAQTGSVSAVVTNPINKAVLYQSGFPYPGHTEFLAHLTGAQGNQVMMLASPVLKVVPVTVHASLQAAISMLTSEVIVSVVRTTYRSLKADFGLALPRIAVAGLNPHAGEHGALGDEEDTVISPAIALLRQEGIIVSGPHSPDTMFTQLARSRYDVAICMYHDQALIPLKTLDMDHGVNVTLGLPIVRTSPDHGTAYDIAGKGLASSTSLIAAIELAATIARRRSDLRN